MCVPHDPTIPAALRSGAELPVAAAATRDAFEYLRGRLDAARPDVIVMVAGDHLNQWFMHQMPQFLIGKAPRAQGPFAHERELFGLEPYDTRIDGALARHLLDRGLDGHFDLAYSNEFTLDHGFVVPLGLLRPEQDVPVVPVFTNVMAPPVAPGSRFFQLGQAVRELIESFDEDSRVAVVTSGHMSNAIGGPRMADFVRQPLSPWDTATWETLHTGDIAELVAGATFERLSKEGNGTPGFLDYVFALGLVGDARATWSQLVSGPTQPPAGFLRWSENDLMAKAD
ncbi:extradiol ring-cleavage dioxygenase [Streptomyces sp. NPDC088746]|uniref:DODA-type extradiol aromatic ring-opening family dioxygenase n=1 Tax=Streptomyces sp. NPDC088746 TaxID=3365885 RepID=UPI00381C6DCB